MSKSKVEINTTQYEYQTRNLLKVIDQSITKAEKCLDDRNLRFINHLKTFELPLLQERLTKWLDDLDNMSFFSWKTICMWNSINNATDCYNTDITSKWCSNWYAKKDHVEPLDRIQFINELRDITKLDIDELVKELEGLYVNRDKASESTFKETYPNYFKFKVLLKYNAQVDDTIFETEDDDETFSYLHLICQDLKDGDTIFNNNAALEASRTAHIYPMLRNLKSMKKRFSVHEKTNMQSNKLVMLGNDDMLSITDVDNLMCPLPPIDLSIFK